MSNYILVVETSQRSFNRECQTKINDGYKPFGEPKVKTTHEYYYNSDAGYTTKRDILNYIQAFVKE